MNNAFYQNNVHPIFTKILIDTDHLSREQIEQIGKVASIELVNFKLFATSRIEKFPVNISFYPTKFSVNETFRRNMIQQGFDFCISNSVPNNAGRVFNIPLVNYNDFMELIRIILVHNNQFYIEPNIKVDNSLYLHYRSNYLFPEYQRIWNSTNHEENVMYFDTMDSIANRLKQLIIAFDECSFYCFENRGIDSLVFAILYFDSFVSQLASIFGNLANAINYCYDINFDKYKTDLRIKKASKFLDIVKKRDSQLYNVIADSDFQDFLKLVVRPLRNNIEHNNIPRGINSKVAISMTICPETWNLIVKLNHKYPQACFFNPKYSGEYIHIAIYPVLKLLMIFGRKYINCIMHGFNLDLKPKNIKASKEFNPLKQVCENSLYFTTYWLPRYYSCNN